MSLAARRGALALAIVAAAAFRTTAPAAVLARNGVAKAVIVLATDAIPSEKTAAAELALYLGKMTGARFEIRSEDDPRPAGLAIFVGPTGLARRLHLDAQRMGPEEWAVKASGNSIVLCGGRPRGTLYAVYHFLEDDLGVRWWNAFEESVPQRPTLRVAELDRRGHPAFVQRDFGGADGRVEFLVRNRVNGASNRIPWSFGGYDGFATPWSVHSFFRAFPPADYFDAHPEYFAERDGTRTADKSQLCLTNPELPAVVAEKLDAYATAAESKARDAGEPTQRLLEFSQNDNFGACTCAACRLVAAREKSESGPLLAFLNDVAGRLAFEHPDALLITLAYTYTFAPPANLKASSHVVVRLTGYGKRDFSKGVLAPENAEFRDAVDAWSRVAQHLWIWDYAVVFFGNDRNLPIPSYRYYAQDFRFYRDHGVSGVFVQHWFPIAADLRDLKVWLYLKLMENPDLDQKALIRDFTDGYYGNAAAAVRRYLDLLEATADKSPGYIGAESNPEAFTYVDADFVVRAEAAFDRAEWQVRRDLVRLRRVRHARLTVDYALLWLGPDVDLAAAARRAGVPAPERLAVAERYQRTWNDQIELRVDAEHRQAMRDDVDAEVQQFLGEGE